MTMTGPRAMTVAEIIKAGHLPPPQMGFLPAVEKAVKVLARTPALKERICEYIQSEVGHNAFSCFIWLTLLAGVH
jgi:protein phosphatase 4 regulatory subunit 3